MAKIIKNITKIYLSLLRIQQVIRLMESADYENHAYVRRKACFSSFYLHLRYVDFAWNLQMPLIFLSESSAQAV